MTGPEIQQPIFTGIQNGNFKQGLHIFCQEMFIMGDVSMVASKINL